MASEATGNGGTQREKGNETGNETDFQSSLGLERLPAVFLNRNSIIATRSITLDHRFRSSR